MKNKKVFVASLVATGLVASGVFGCMGMHKGKKDTVKKLQHETDSLIAQRNQYDARRDFYFSAAAENTEKNPDCDNMKKLLDLVCKLDASIWQKYHVIENNFTKKCKLVAQRSLGEQKKYYLPGADKKIKPYFAEDWMKIIHANSAKIPGVGKLDKEYEKIEELRKFIYSFELFVFGDFAVYVFDDSDFFKETGIFEESGDLIDNKICRYNDADNIKQNHSLAKSSSAFFASAWPCSADN